MSEQICDLYLYKFNNSKFLTKIPSLEFSKGIQCAQKWTAIDSRHDYILVTKDSKPWHEEPEQIDIKDVEWLEQEYQNYMKG